MWNPGDHPRDARGRFAGRGGAARTMAAATGTAARGLFETAKHGPPSRPQATVDPLGESRQLAAAFHAGYSVDAEISQGDGNNPTVHRITLSDGTPAVLKHTPLEMRQHNPDVVSQDHLGTLTGRALGIDGIGSAKIDDDTQVTKFVPGRTGSETIVDTVAADPSKPVVMEVEIQQHTQLKNGDKIGLMDYLTNETDRHSGNYLVDGDTVRPIDQGEAQFLPSYNYGTGEYTEGPELRSPFSQAHLAVEGNPDEVQSPFSKAELNTFYERLRKLEPEFEKENATLKWQYAMSRLYQLKEATD